MKIVKKILPIFAVLFFCLILFFSFILLNRNKFGVFEFQDKVYVNISNNNSSKTFKRGSLVVLNKATLNDLNIDQDIFIYKQNEKTKTIQLISSKVKKIEIERKAIIATHDGKYYTEDFIAGTPDKSIPFWGGFFDIVLSKWFFLIFILVPAFAIVVYEIYLLFIAIKYGDLGDEDEDTEVSTSEQTTVNNVVENNPVTEEQTAQQQNNVEQPVEQSVEQTTEQPVTEQLSPVENTPEQVAATEEVLTPPVQQQTEQPVQQNVEQLQPTENAEVLNPNVAETINNPVIEEPSQSNDDVLNVEVEVLDSINDELKKEQDNKDQEEPEPTEEEKKK